MRADDIVVHKDKNGVYFARPYLGKDVNGKPIRPSKWFPEAKSREEAQRMAREWASGLTPSAGMHIGRTIGEAAERYMRSLKARKASPSTLRTYRSILKCYILPLFGRMAPQELQPYMVEDFYTEALIDGVCGRDQIAPNYVRKIHGFMKGFYRWMLRQGALEVDPMPSVEAPAKEIVEAGALDEDQMALVDSELRRIVFGSDARAVARACALASYISLWCGTREGEDCGLGKGDVKVASGFLHIHANAVESDQGVERRTKTKGKKSRNVRMTSRVADAIEAQWAWQEDEYGDEARKAKFPVCSGPKGGLVRPSSVSRWFKGLSRDLGLPDEIHFHTLRHTHASVLLAEGMDLKTLAERLGHSKESLTLETYSHVMPGRDDRAVDLLDGVSERIEG